MVSVQARLSKIFSSFFQVQPAPYSFPDFRMPVCCLCNGSGPRCMNFVCVKAGQFCDSCAAGRADRCHNQPLPIMSSICLVMSESYASVTTSASTRKSWHERCSLSPFIRITALCNYCAAWLTAATSSHNFAARARLHGGQITSIRQDPPLI